MIRPGLFALTSALLLAGSPCATHAQQLPTVSRGAGAVQVSGAKLADSATALYNAHRYVEAATLFAQSVRAARAHEDTETAYRASYNGACSWALAGVPDSAFAMLAAVATDGAFGTAYAAQARHDDDFTSLHADPRWAPLLASLQYEADSVQAITARRMAELTDPRARVTRNALLDTAYWERVARTHSAMAIRDLLARAHPFSPAPTTGQWTVDQLTATDDSGRVHTVPFLLYVPKNYDPRRATPLLVFLHGGVGGRTTYPDPLFVLAHDTALLAPAMHAGMLVLYPFARQDFNWLKHHAALVHVLDLVRFVKARYNVDDTRVYLAGHSDGARATFWMATHQPNTFAAFLGLNYFPRSLLGNTAVANLCCSAPFFGISGADDAGFNANQVTALAAYGQGLGARWTAFVRPGDHGLPYERPDVVAFGFDSLAAHRGQPWPRALAWATDDTRDGRVAWLSITALDTLASPAAWYAQLAPTIPGRSGLQPMVLDPRRAGAVRARITGQDVYIETSRVRALTLYVSPDLLDVRRPVRLHVNDRPVTTVRVRADPRLVVAEFLRTGDRTAPALATVPIEIR